MLRLAQVGNDLYSGKRSFTIVGRRRVWYAVSVVLILLSLLGLVGRGLNFGIEFRGGTEMRVTGISDMSDYETRATETVQQTAPEAATITVTQVGNDGVRIQTGDLETQAVEEARAALAEQFSVPAADVTSSFVGPSWGETVTTKAVQALVVFLLLVSLVLAVYFSTWKMALAALVAVLHDVVFTVGLYALLGIEVSPASVIGFLTILGYSIYDTIVVFDKVRENTEYALESRTMSYAEAANLAVNQTLVRSVNTSVVALLPVGAILLFGITLIGPGTLLDLAAALFIGIAVGTYSSVFVATPLLVHLREGEEEIRRLDHRVERRRAEQPLAVGVGAPDTPADRPAAPTELAEGEQAPAATGSEEEHTHLTGQLPPAGEPEGGAPGDRELHPFAQRGPRNQPRRRNRRRR